jgi:hypothetical protein
MLLLGLPTELKNVGTNADVAGQKARSTVSLFVNEQAKACSTPVLALAANRKESMVHDKVANGNSKCRSVDAGCAKVYASENARVLYLFQSG